ncbi:hypothetical protein [Bosea sp. NPDC055594]
MVTPAIDRGAGLSKNESPWLDIVPAASRSSAKRVRVYRALPNIEILPVRASIRRPNRQRSETGASTCGHKPERDMMTTNTTATTDKELFVAYLKTKANNYGDNVGNL